MSFRNFVEMAEKVHRLFELGKKTGELAQTLAPAPKLSPEELQAYLARACERTNTGAPQKLSERLQFDGMSATGTKTVTYEYRLLQVVRGNDEEIKGALAQQRQNDMVIFRQASEFEKVCRAYGVTKIFRFKDKEGHSVGENIIAAGDL